MKTDLFNSSRFGLLLKRQIILNYKTWLTALISVGGAIIFIAFLNLVFSQDNSWISIFDSLGVVAFFITGLVFASLSFSEMGTYSKSLQYITLPASMFEKFTASWLLTSMGYVIFSTFTLLVSSAFMGFISLVAFKGEFLMFNPFTSQYGNAILAYFIAHTIFFLGAVWFKKAAFFKTLLTMFVINIITNTWFFAWVMIVINPFKMALEMNNTYIPFQSFTGIESVIQFWVITFSILISVILLITAWIRFKEREV